MKRTLLPFLFAACAWGEITTIFYSNKKVKGNFGDPDAICQADGTASNYAALGPGKTYRALVLQRNYMESLRELFPAENSVQNAVQLRFIQHSFCFGHMHRNNARTFFVFVNRQEYNSAQRILIACLLITNKRNS